MRPSDSLCSSGYLMEVGPLRSVGITRLHGYYGPVRIPADHRGGYVFPPRIGSRTRPAGPPRSRRASQVQKGLPGSDAFIHHPPSDKTPGSWTGACTDASLSMLASAYPRDWPPQVVSNEACIGLLALRLTASLAKAPHGPSRARTLGSLHVSSAVHMVNSLHLTGRRQLAWRTEQFGQRPERSFS